MPDYKLAATRAAQKFGVDPKIFLAMIQQESGFNPHAHSGAGAQGIAQFMPATAKGYGVNLNDSRVTDDLEGAARYLADNLKKTGGNYHQALSIYNSGRADAYKDPSFANGQTFHYVKTILGNAASTGAPRARGTSPSPSAARTVTTSKTVGGVDNSALRQAAIAQFLQTKGADPVDFAMQVRALKDVPGRKVTTTRTTAPSASSGNGPQATSFKAAKGVASFEGKKVAAWIAPILSFARQHGWKGTINSGYRSYADQQRIYNSGVRPAAKPGTSNHEFTAYPGGAIDVSDAATLSKILANSPYAKRLVWAGSKDPVHFSHPHNGSY
jgi:hypothetical protein